MTVYAVWKDNKLYAICLDSLTAAKLASSRGGQVESVTVDTRHVCQKCRNFLKVYKYDFRCDHCDICYDKHGNVVSYDPASYL